MDWKNTFGDVVTDLGSSYPQPSSGFNIDFLDPSNSSTIDWADIYANSDILDNIGDSYNDVWEDKGGDFLQDFLKGSASDQEPSNLAALKSQSGLPVDRKGDWYRQITPSVGVWDKFGNLGSSYPYSGLSSPISNFGQPLQQSMGFKDVVGAGMRMAGQQLANKALYAINPVLGAVNQFYPGGAQQAFKDVGNVAGDVGNTVARFAVGAVKGGINLVKDAFDWLCDERLKVDIAPLESTEVNDELAQMAFFVKGIRECS